MATTKGNFPSPKETRSKGGRPKGAVGLTNETQEKILALIRAGAWGYVAAEAAGVPARTYYEWMARGEGRSARGATPKLVGLAAKVRKAEAEARVVAEASVYRDRQALWLSRRARSRPGREGWTEPAPNESESVRFSLHLKDYQDPDARAELYRVFEVMLQIEPSFIIPPCSHPRCRCPWHSKRRAEELQGTRRAR